jgi:hypothetical protein
LAIWASSGAFAPREGPKVPLSCWFGSVAIAQRLADFGMEARAHPANHGIVTVIGQPAD